MPPESVPPRVPLYVCPQCASVRLPDGTEEEYGPPECNHGLLFGTDPSGGGEVEMIPVEYAPVSSGVDEGGEVCKKCGQFVATTCPSWWSAPDALWNEVEGGPGGIRCIRCFTEDCEAKGIWVYWQAVVDGRAASVQPEANSPGEKRNDELVEADTLLGGDSRQLGVEGGRHA